MIQNAGIEYQSQHINKNAMPTIFPQKTNNLDDVKNCDPFFEFMKKKYKNLV